MEEEQTDPPSPKDKKNLADKLPEELREIYNRARKGSAVVERLRGVAALKLWFDRGYREFGFEVPSDVEGKTVHIDVLAQDAEGMVGVECVSKLNLARLRSRIEQLRRCLPDSGYLVVVLPFGIDEGCIDTVAELADEVWVTNKDNTKVERTIGTSVFHKG